MSHAVLRIPDAEQARLDGMFRELCCGNPDATHVCWSLYQFLHVIDDLVDRDVEVTPATVGLSLLGVIEAMSANPFAVAHRDMLLASLRVAVAEWIDSEHWRTSPDARRRAAVSVLKSQYQNLFYLIASLCGGPAHMVAMTAKYRDYDWENAVDVVGEVTVTCPRGAP